jgi:hypothetical protein
MGEAAIHHRADWPFIQNGAVTLFLNQAVLDAAIADVRREGYVVQQIDCGNEKSLVRDFAKALHWLEQFGDEPGQVNLNALNDALRYEPCVERPRLVLVLDGFAELQSWDKAAAHELLDMIESNSRDHLRHGQRLLAFVRTNDPTMHITGLGAQSARWNRKEWLMKSRGV